MSDLTHELQQRVQQALAEREPLSIHGAGSKAFYGREASGRPIEVSAHRGIISYEPTELVVTARAGTPLVELDAALAGHGQMLPFEPPRFGDATAIGGTIGGTVACNLCGPRRPYTGAVRDYLLGVRILNGKGERLHFGGEVMKNVAGYDLSRLMAGAMGTLGLLLEVSLKVLPRPEREITLVHEGVSAEEALTRLTAFARRPLDISASAIHGDRLSIRVCGTHRGVEATHGAIGGDALDEERSASFWSALREQHHGFFDDPRPLWRLSLPPTTPPLELGGEWLYEWGGAQRWLHTEQPPEALFELASKHAGHATAYRNQPTRERVFQPLPEGLKRLHRNLKHAMDPYGLLNPGRLYPDL